MTADNRVTAARTILTRARHVAAFSGAGLSAESGISTFRDTGDDALWSRFNPMELASREGFLANAQRVIDWYTWRRLNLAKAGPNDGHCALAAQEGLIQITQNVDNLLEQAGIPERRVLHLHGTITKDRCDNGSCGHEELVDLDNPPPFRTCPQCDHPMRPAVVWFGESLPEQTLRESEVLCTRIDCLLVIGTSASVFPAAGLIRLAKDQGARIIIINTRANEASEFADVELIGPSGKILPELLDGLQLSSA